MKIVEINMVSTGSTGNIMLNIAKVARENGHEVITYSTNVFSKKYRKLPPAPYGHKYFGTYLENGVHKVLAMLFGATGQYSYFSTKRLIKDIKKFKPDVINLHNLHNFCFNLPSFFKFVKKNNIRVVWTLHDCWSFTGHCPYFDMIGCDKWKTACYDCPQYNKGYLKTWVDGSKKMYKNKKKWLTGAQDMTLITPSQWLANLTRQSYLKEYPVKVINNGIDLNIFKPTDSDFKEKYSLQDKKIVLGVAFGWGERKGLDAIVELSKTLPNNYQIVLVGASSGMEKFLPNNVLCILKTNSKEELAKIYSSADVFINPTREDNFPTVNIEAIACGTPVITFNTGGSPEIIDETCGIVVEKNDVDGMLNAIIKVCENRPFKKEDCVNRAKNYDMNDKFKEYVELYEDITHSAQ